MWYDTPLFNTGGYNFRIIRAGSDYAWRRSGNPERHDVLPQWTEDPTVQKVEATLDLPSDLYGPSQADSPNPFMVDADGYKTFSLTGLINMKSVRRRCRD